MIPRGFVAFIDLANRCQPEYMTWIAVGPGWWPIVLDLHRRIWERFPDYRVQQVKEKYGGLRYYCDHDDDPEVASWIRQAEGRASVTCEVCGGAGRLRKTGWLSTRCDEHAA